MSVLPKLRVARVIVLDQDGRILVLRRSHTAPLRALAWDLPGGLVDTGETPEAGAIRELEEEAGIEVDGVELYIAAPKPSGIPGFFGSRSLYLARVSQTEVTLSYEHDQYKWATKEQLMALDLPKFYKDAVRRLP